MQERIYIKLTTTESALSYRLEETDDISLVGYARYIDAKDLSNPFNVPDFLEDLLLDGHLKSYDVIMI